MNWLMCFYISMTHSSSGGIVIVSWSWSPSCAAAMPERVHSFRGQNFHALRRWCLRRGSLFKDPLFPAAAQSLFYRREPPPGVTWKRPRVSHGHQPLFTHWVGLIKALSIMVQGASENWAHPSASENNLENSNSVEIVQVFLVQCWNAKVQSVKSASFWTESCWSKKWLMLAWRSVFSRKIIFINSFSWFQK